MDSVEPSPAAAQRCWVTDRFVWLEFSDGRKSGFPASRFPILADAPQHLLKKVQLRVKGLALRWEELDEDIWIEDAVNGRFPRSLATAG